jgi:hypothetical protein
MQIDFVAVMLAGAFVGELVAIALGIGYFRDYTRNSQLRSGEMAWARAIRLSWILLLMSASALVPAILNVAIIPSSKAWAHAAAIACVVTLGAVVFLVLTVLVIAYMKARADAR